MDFSYRTTGDITPLAPGETFSSGSEYRLLERLGRGGMGEVWKAERTSAAGHKQTVAVKFLTDHRAEQSSLAAEALRMSCLNHDNIVPFLDSGFDGVGRTFVAMAFVQGMDLDGLRDHVGMRAEAAYGGGCEQRIPDQIVGFILFMTLRALSYAHTFPFGDGVVGLIHRDVSPGNILLDEKRGFVKLSDFGVAAVQGDEEGQGKITGKIPYMAPEVLLQDPVDARADLYSLGLVAYELLTGFNPNIRPHAMNSVIGAITEVMLSLDCPLRPPHEVVEGVSPVLSGIVARMLEKDPARRFPERGGGPRRDERLPLRQGLRPPPPGASPPTSPCSRGGTISRRSRPRAPCASSTGPRGEAPSCPAVGSRRSRRR